MKKRFAWVFLGSLLASSVCLGALPFYLTLSDIEGECTLPGRQGTILVYAYSQNLVSQLNESTGLPTGKRQHKPLVITKAIDKSSPAIMGAWASNKKMGFTLNFYMVTAQGREICYYSISLTDAQIIGIEQHKPLVSLPDNGTNMDMEEHVSFVYSSITYKVAPPNNGIIERRDFWQSAAAQLVSDLNNDSIVNMEDLSILVSQWLKTAS